MASNDYYPMLASMNSLQLECLIQLIQIIVSVELNTVTNHTNLHIEFINNNCTMNDNLT